MKTRTLSFAALLLAGCEASEQALIESQLEKAVMRAERMAVEDSETLSDDCLDEPTTWRAPISSLTQDIRVQRCDIVYYYLARYSPVEGDVVPITFVYSTRFLGTENLLTGEKIHAD